MKALILYPLLLLTSLGCEPTRSTDEQQQESGAPSWYQPKVGVTWQWQLQGEINSNYPAEIYDIDLFDTTENKIAELQRDNKKVICYFSAGSYEQWRTDAQQFLATDLGNNLDGWIGERWLDIRSEHVLTIMKNRLTLAQTKGCDGVEPDNVDGYSNDSGFNLSAADQLIFNISLAKEAHSRGLSIGLKNDVQQVEQLVEHFDFAVNEQCFEYNECNQLTPFINAGKAVLQVEYLQEYVTSNNARETLCNNALSNQFSTLVLPLALDDSYRFSCW